MLQAVAVTDVAIGRQTVFAVLLRSYHWILVWIVVALGLGLVVGVPLNRIGVVHPARTSTIEIKGPAARFSRETFVADVVKIYRPSAYVRVLTNGDGAHGLSSLHFGAQTFNANGREFRSGSVRIGAPMPAGSLSIFEQSWAHIADLGDTSHAGLRPGAGSVKLVPLPGYQLANDKTTVMRNVSFHSG